MAVEMLCSMDELQVGDTFMHDIYSSTGILLARRGSVVDKSLLQRLSLGRLDKYTVRRSDHVAYQMVSASDVVLGDYIAEDVKSPAGIIMVYKGSCVDEIALRYLRQYDGDVLIQVDGELDEDVKFTETKLLHIDSSVRDRVKEGIEYIFSEGLSSREVVDAARDLSGILCATVLSSDAVGLDLNSIKVSDEYTFKHSVDVSTLGAFAAKKLGYPSESVSDIALAGLLHDLGKVKIPNEILNKPGKLTDEEFEIIRNHPMFGYDLVKDMDGLSEESKIGILMHHEKVNGTGYCYGISGDDITKVGRLMAVVDVYDALVTKRPYKEPIAPVKALDIMRGETGHYDYSLFKKFVSCLVLYPAGSKVNLSNGDKGVVVRNNDGYPYRPCIRSTRTGKYLDLLRDRALRGVRIC